MEAAVRALLSRSKALAIRALDYDTFVHPRRDPGCFGEGHEFLLPLRADYAHGLVVFDQAWEGAPSQSAASLEEAVRGRLAGAGLAEWATSWSSSRSSRPGSGATHLTWTKPSAGRSEPRTAGLAEAASAVARPIAEASRPEAGGGTGARGRATPALGVDLRSPRPRTAASIDAPIRLSTAFGSVCGPGSVKGLTELSAHGTAVDVYASGSPTELVCLRRPGSHRPPPCRSRADVVMGPDPPPTSWM